MMTNHQFLTIATLAGGSIAGPPFGFIVLPLAFYFWYRVYKEQVIKLVDCNNVNVIKSLSAEVADLRLTLETINCISTDYVVTNMVQTSLSKK